MSCLYISSGWEDNDWENQVLIWGSKTACLFTWVIVVGPHNHRSTGKGISLTLETQPQPRTPGHLPCQSHPTWSCWWAQHICTHISDEQHQQKKHLTSWISASVWGWPDLKMRKISPRCWGKLRCWTIVVGWLVHSVRQQLSDSLMCQKKKKKKC